MNHLNDMLESIEELTEELIEDKRRMFEEVALIHSGEVKKILMDVIEEGGRTETSQLLITYLRSSYITRTHKFKIALYQQQFFIEEPLAYTYYSLASLFDAVTDDMAAIKKTLNKSFIRIRSCDIEEIRRRYFEQIYVEAKILFQIAVNEDINEIGCQIFYGQEMGSVEIIS